MNHPILKLQFDNELDQNVAWNFYNHQEYDGSNFWEERAIRYHPSLTDIESIKNKREYLDKYISDYYVSHAKEIKSQTTDIEYLRKTEEKYFRTVDKIFEGYPWPKSKLIGNYSIFDFCPRFLEDGEFQVFINDNHNLKLFTIFHECLHFIFYDFAKKKFPGTLGKMNTEEGKFWDMAEVFNVVIQSSDDFIDLHGKIENMGYPNHKDLITQGNLIWKKDPNVYNWISCMLKIV